MTFPWIMVLNMHTNFNRRISDMLSPRSLRTAFGYVVFFLLVVLPTAIVWESGAETDWSAPQGSPRPLNGIRSPMAPRGWADSRPSVREQMNRSWWPDVSSLLWLFGRTSLAVFGATLSLMILMPFRGCKRFAVLFGPPTGLIVVGAVSLWLSGRTEIYRFEPILVAVVAALPTASLWFLCCQWAYERPVHSEHVVEAH